VAEDTDADYQPPPRKAARAAGGHRNATLREESTSESEAASSDESASEVDDEVGGAIGATSRVQRKAPRVAGKRASLSVSDASKRARASYEAVVAAVASGTSSEVGTCPWTSASGHGSCSVPETRSLLSFRWRRRPRWIACLPYLAR